MEKQVYRFAGHAVEIRSLYPQIYTMCGAYRTEAPPELVLSIGQSEIDCERRRLGETETAEDAQGRHHSDGYLETLAVHRKLAESLIAYNILLFHGSAVAVDGAGYLFAARSGTGKSTHARLWRELLGERAVMVNDDKPFLAVSDTGAAVWGSPWDGKHHLSHNISAPLRAICFLEQGEENRIKAVSAKEGWPALWRQCYRPSEPEKLKRTVALVDSLSKHTRLYRLSCTPELQAARLAYETMSRG